MANRESPLIEITPEVLLKAYACGIFPMAENADDPTLYWIEPEMRGIIPLDRFCISGRLARTVRSDRFTVTLNRDFDAVLEGCAEPRPGRPRTWINGRIRILYRKLLEAALTGEADFAALGAKRPVTGAQALAQLASDRLVRA